MHLELEGEVEDVCEAEEEEEYPAVIDDEVPGPAHVLVLEDESYLIEEVEASSAAGTTRFLCL